MTDRLVLIIGAGPTAADRMTAAPALRQSPIGARRGRRGLLRLSAVALGIRPIREPPGLHPMKSLLGKLA